MDSFARLASERIRLPKPYKHLRNRALNLKPVRGHVFRAVILATSIAGIPGANSVCSLRRLHAQDLVDTRVFGERGVVFEGPYELPLGESVEDARGVGDVDGDGLDDIVIVFNEEPSPELEERTGVAAVALVYGARNLPTRLTLPLTERRSAVFRVSLERPWVRFRQIRALGDVDGDGLADFGLGAESYPGGGRIFLIRGSRDLDGEYAIEQTGTPDLPGTVIIANWEETGGLGRAFGPIGDFDGDGREDLAFAAPSTSLSGEQAGVVSILYGSDAAWPPLIDLADVGDGRASTRILGVSHPVENEPGIFDGDLLGTALEGVGDFDGDGLDDCLIGAATFRGGAFPSRCYLLYGRSDPPAVIDLADLEGGQLDGITIFEGHSGRDRNIARLGDLDGDGLADLVLSDSGDTSLIDPRRGVVHIVHGRGDLPQLVSREALDALAVRVTPFRGGDEFGVVAAAGDLDLDGVPDLLIGAPRASREGLRDVGEAYVLRGARQLPPELALSDGFEGTRLLGAGLYDRFGAQVASAGDFNGDGLPDLLAVATYRASRARPPNVGKAYLIYGVGSGDTPLGLWSAEPSSASIRGGATITLRGSGFSDTPEVRFGGRSSGAVTVESPSELSVRVPPRSEPAVVDIEIALAGETQSLVDAFEYTPPLPSVDLAELGSRGLVVEGKAGIQLGQKATILDIDGDGFSDLVLSAHVDNRWALVIIEGRADFPPTIPDFLAFDSVTLLTTNLATVDEVTAIDALGDVNGDGLRDLGFVAGPLAGFLLLGRRELETTLTIEDEIALGRAVRFDRGAGDVGSSHRFAPTGDVDGDGIDDLAVGTVAGRFGQGLAFGPGEVLYVAGREDWPELFDLDAPDALYARITGSGGQALGEELVGAGDVNGDGSADLLASTRTSGVSRSYVLLGPSGLRNLPESTTIDAQVLAGGAMEIDVEVRSSSSSVLSRSAPAGDFNGDGFGDVVVSVEENGDAFEGVTYLIPGAADLPERRFVPRTPAKPDGILRAGGEGSQSRSGRPAPAGDFDADGFDDFLVRATFLDADEGLPSLRGVLWLLRGDPEPEPELELARIGGHGLRLPVDPPSSIYQPPPVTGDVDGDGRDDFLLTIRRPSLEVGVEESSRVIVVYGYGSAQFIRGDANLDRRIDLSDAVAILQSLFLGTVGLPCDDSADVDDRGDLVLTDAVYLLNHLFVGGPAPPQPFPQVGEDPTDDGLGCLGF